MVGMPLGDAQAGQDYPREDAPEPAPLDVTRAHTGGKPERIAVRKGPERIAVRRGVERF